MQPFNNKLILYIYMWTLPFLTWGQAIRTYTVTYMSRQLHSKNIHCSCNTFLLNTPTPRRILPSMWQKFEVKKWRSTRFHPPSTPSFDLNDSTFDVLHMQPIITCCMFPKEETEVANYFSSWQVRHVASAMGGGSGRACPPFNFLHRL